MNEPRETAALSHTEGLEVLHEAERDRAALVADLKVPRGYDAAMAGALSSLIVASAIDMASDAAWAKGLFAVAIIGLFATASRQVHRFRQLNGVWVSGMRRGATVPAMVASLAIYVAAVIGAMGAGAERLWWLVVLIAVAAGGGFILASRWWMRLYRGEQGATR